MALTDWKSTQSDGTLPNEFVAAQFQYKRFLHWEADIFSFGIGGREATGTWKIQIKNGDAVLFEQEVKLTLWLVSLGTIGLQLYTWAFRREVITTTKVGGVEITEENPSWSYTLGGTEFSEFGTLIPGGGSGYTDVTAYIDAEWQSPVYRMTVPVGAKLDVVMDAWGLGASTRPEWQFRFQEGALRLVDTAPGYFGEIVAARPLSGVTGRQTMQGGHSWPFHKSLSAHGFIRGASEPSLVMEPDGREILGVLQSDGYWEYESLNTQRSWKKVKYPVAGQIEKKEQAIFDASVQMPQLIKTENGRLALARRGSFLVVRFVGEEGVGATKRVGPAAGDKSYSLTVDDQGLYVICDDSGLPVYESADGLNWNAPSMSWRVQSLL